jgi:uncharacterized membrane protein YgaE (UPF0421/DUF939 family)
MLTKKVILLSVFCCLHCLSSGQNVTVSSNPSCPLRNISRIVQALIVMKGDRAVEQMLADNVQFVAIWQLDTLNHVVRLEHGYSRNENDKKEVEKMIDELTDFLKEHRIFLEMCYAYEIESGKTCEEVKQIIEQDMQKGKTKMRTHVLFPTGLLIYDEAQQEKDRRQGIYLTRLEYLEQQIEKYLSQSNPVNN